MRSGGEGWGSRRGSGGRLAVLISIAEHHRYMLTAIRANWAGLGEERIKQEDAAYKASNGLGDENKTRPCDRTSELLKCCTAVTLTA